MVNPLTIMVALHYWTTPGEYSEHDQGHAKSPAVGEAVKRLIEAGLLMRSKSLHRAPWETTPAMRVWVEGLCNVPFPVQQWVLPKQEARACPAIAG